MKEIDRLQQPFLDERLFAQLFPEFRGSRRRRIQMILDAAIRVYVRLGPEKTTVAEIAESAKLTRPAITYYFKDKDRIFDAVVRYVRARFQDLAIQSMKSESDAEAMLAAYIHSTFHWIECFPDHVKIWGFYYAKCIVERDSRALNTQMVEIGAQRVAAILELGRAQGKFSDVATPRIARQIHLLLTGTLLASVTENSALSLAETESRLLEAVHRLVGWKGSAV